MKTYKSFLISGIFVIMLSLITLPKTFAQLPPNDPAYELVFSDEFSGTSLDNSKWLKRYPWHQSSNFAFFCQDSLIPIPMAAIKVSDAFGANDTTNCKISGGTLKLIARKENYSSPCWTWPSCIPLSNCNVNGVCDDTINNTCWNIQNKNFKFTSAMLYSKDDFRYGYYEIRFKYPALPTTPKTYKGHGAGFWLWSGGDGVTNDWSEIDFPETNAYCEACPDKYYNGGANVWYRPIGDTLKDDPSVQFNFEPDTWYTTGINWTSNSIDFYIDNSLVYTSYHHPRDLSPMSIILNLGGCYQPLDNFCIPYDTVNANGTQFPYAYEIDYVRVYQLKESCSTNLSISSFDPSTYDNRLYKSVTMGTNINITNNSYQSFWGQDYILINDGTSIDNNSNVLFNATNCGSVHPAKAPESLITPPPASFIDKINHIY